MDDFTPLNLFDDGVDKAVEAKETIPSEKTTIDDMSNMESLTEEKVDVNEKEPEKVLENSEDVSNDASEDDESTENENPLEEKSGETIQDDKLDIMLTSQQKLSEKIDELSALFNARIMHTDHEEKIVDQMHKELQKYKEDMYAQLVRPILLDVIEVRDSIMRIASTYLAKPEGEQNIPNKTFSDYAYDLQDILEKNSVEIYRSKSGDDFTPIKQRVIKKLPTSNESLHGKVAESLSCGYSYNGRTISAEKITIYYYEKPVENNENSEVIENG